MRSDEENVKEVKEDNKNDRKMKGNEKKNGEE